LALGDQHGAVGLLGKPAGLDADGLSVDGTMHCFHSRSHSSLLCFTRSKERRSGAPHGARRVSRDIRLIPRLSSFRLDTRSDPCPTSFRGEPGSLATQPQIFDQGLVATLVSSIEVVEQASPLAHELQQPAARGVVFHVRLEMIREFGDPLREERDLYFAGARVSGFALVLAYDFVPTFGSDHALLLRKFATLYSTKPRCRQRRRPPSRALGGRAGRRPAPRASPRGRAAACPPGGRRGSPGGRAGPRSVFAEPVGRRSRRWGARW